VPSRTATLLAVCVAHARAEGARNVQWLADAKMVLGGDVRWNELLAAAGEHRQVIRLREAMRYFARLPGPKPPPAFFDQLSETTVTSRERLSYYLASSDSSRAGTLPRLAAEHVVRTADQSSLRALATFPRHLRERWGLSHTWRVPFAAGQRALRLLLGNPDRPP